MIACPRRGSNLALVLGLLAQACTSQHSLGTSAVDAGPDAGICEGGTSAADCLEVLALSAGSRHTCVLRRGGRVDCFGANDRGQLGDGTTGGRPSPASVASEDRLVALGSSQGDHQCVGLETGAWACFGRNGDGQLGDGLRLDRTRPHETVWPELGVEQLSAGFDGTCGKTVNRQVVCFGGDFGSTPGLYHSAVLLGVSEVSVGRGFMCALQSSGLVSCAGRNEEGQLGRGDRVDGPPAPTSTSSGAISVACGESHACALHADGTVACWGRNEEGQLGDGSFESRLAPVTVTGISGAVELAVGARFSCAVSARGRVSCWGENGSGQLGRSGGDGSVAEEVQGLEGAVSVELGDAHACALIGDGSVWCWGENGNGQLGDGTFRSRAEPEPAEL